MRFAVLVLTIAFSSQAWSDEVTRSDLDSLRERATAYWLAKTSGAPVAGFYVNGEIREGLGVTIEAAKVGSVEVLDTTGTVDVDVRVARYTFPKSPQMAQLLNSEEIRNQRIRDSWTRVDGTWYRRPPRNRERDSAMEQSSGGEVASDHLTVSE